VSGQAREHRSAAIQRVPLRITLVGLLVALVALALLVTGTTATSLLKGYLQDQRDEELASWARSVTADPWDLLHTCKEAPPQIGGSYEYLACLPSDGSSPAVFGDFRRGKDDLPSVSSLPAEWRDGRVPPPGRPGRDHEDDGLAQVESEDGRSTFRLVAAQLPEGWVIVRGVDADRDDGVIARLVAIEVVVGLVVLTLLGAMGYVLVRNSLRPLGEVERTAKAIAAGDLSQRVPEGDERTEVGRLSTALNGMLARIESAFRAQQASEEHARGSAERMRRFVADASHELRTPLTSIRGFAELYRQGAVREPAEVSRLMQRIEAEGARMGLLVEDLLLLARLDQQRPLSIAPVDLAEVAGDAVHDAAALQPERPISLRLDDSLTEIPMVLGDEARLRQVVGNLVTNALTHTPPTAAVTITLAEDPSSPDVVVLQIADQGPGMAPEHADRVFERFYRADTARTRAAGGTGLGLAIVASLVAAHGGTVDLVTAAGQGAVFTVRLPRSGPPEGAAAPDPGVVG
jgi:two-component system, OmpR family, sensor kinase